MYIQNRLTGRHRNHYSHQNLHCSAYASHYPKTTPNLQPIPPPFDPLARKRPLVRRKAMVRRKITYYKMLTPERRAEIAAAVGATNLRSQARFAAGQSRVL